MFLTINYGIYYGIRTTLTTHSVYDMHLNANLFFSSDDIVLEIPRDGHYQNKQE